MSEPRDERPDADGEPEPDPVFLLLAGAVIYGAMAGAALLWLWLRDRSDELVHRAIGEHGPLLASGIGLVAGLLGAWSIARFSARNEGVRRMSSSVQRLFGAAPPAVAIAFVLIGAVAEELFFRLAVMDAFGLLGSVAAYVLLNSTVGGPRWLVFTLLHASTLGLLVHFGFGLLASTTAHAVLNYLTLRRIQDS